MTTPPTPQAPGQITLGTARGRWVVTATVLGSSMAFLDSTVVNVALPTIGRELHTSLAGLQWTVTAYTLTLAGLILLGGSLGDRFGRRRVFLIGVIWFALASAVCGVAPDIGVLVVARAVQGIGGALLTPGSLAIIQSTFAQDDRPRAIGAWSGLGGVAGAVGPFLGGWIVGSIGWRWIFLLNLPLAAAVVLVTVRHVPESRDPDAHGRFDIAGSALTALALAGITEALIEAQSGRPLVVAVSAVAGLAAGAGFVLLERHRGRHPDRVPPMLPLSIFRNREFTAINVITFVVYGAMGAVFFLLVLDLQIVAGFSPLEAGISLLPSTVALLLLSARAGALAQKIGPRWLMTGGLLTTATGLLLLTRIGPNASYVADVLPAVLLFGVGLSMTVAPLTATVLASADDRHAGIASGVNNATARAAGLLAVAGLPAAVGLSGTALHDRAQLNTGFHQAMAICAALMALAAGLSAVLVSNDVLKPKAGEPVTQPECLTNCPVGAPPLEPSAHGPAPGAADRH
ncbi:MAG TPA: MFS transporter [Streptosporangiaceae bacterium]|nr:MFS transporter [Streptosporangiaceae bacterium]